jgi:hypothetical protein
MAVGAGDYFGFLNATSLEGNEEDLNRITEALDGFLPLCVWQR